MMNEFRNIQEKVYEVKLKTLQNNLDAVIGEQTDFYTRTIYELIDRIDKTTKEVKELYEMAKEQDSDNVNLIDRLELILKILGGENYESN